MRWHTSSSSASDDPDFSTMIMMSSNYREHGVGRGWPVALLVAPDVLSTGAPRSTRRAASIRVHGSQKQKAAGLGPAAWIVLPRASVRPRLLFGQVRAPGGPR